MVVQAYLKDRAEGSRQEEWIESKVRGWIS